MCIVENYVLNIVEAIMRIKPYASINFCYKCKRPVPRIGLSICTGTGNISATTPFICPWCKAEKKKR